jgi:hypothetical protein
MTSFDHLLLTVALAAGLGLSGCAGASQSTGLASAPPSGGPATHAASHHPHPRRRGSRHHRRKSQSLARPPANHRHPVGSALAFSTASNSAVQPQPPPGSCHTRGSGLFSRPDPRCTPGALNPAVTQATIDRTICVSGWTETVRPPESVTEAEKAASMAAYGDGGAMGDYEYDHFVPLELGGATNDPRNLWPEPGGTPNPKDDVENELHDEVCGGQISLAAAQREIVRNWTKLAPHPAAPPAPAGSSTGAANCTATASYSSSYGDYDVYVHSNQPDQTVTVTDTDGHTASWHTDSSGYADVYFKSGGYAPGRQITVRVGGATCSATL